MKFYLKPKKEYKIGDTKIVSSFLLFPKRIGNEIRWLEKVLIVKKKISSYTHDEICGAMEVYEWEDYAWVEDK